MVAGSYWPRPDDDLHWLGHVDGLFFDQVPHRWLDVWGRWDTALYYVPTARDGYPGLPSDGSWNYAAAYFPLLPLLMRGLSTLLFGLDPFIAGVILVNAALATAIVFLDKLMRLDHSPERAELVIACLMAFPGSYFLSCVYPESLTLLGAVVGVYAARTNRFFVAALACALVAVARSSGIFVAGMVLLEMLRTREGGWRFSWGVLWLVLPVASLGAWAYANWALWGDPLYFVHVQAGWGREASFFLSTLLKPDLSYDYHLLALLFLALAVAGFALKERASYVAFSSANILLPLSTGILRGVHRYMTSNFPAFLFLARLLETRPWGRRAYFAVGLTSMALFAFRWGQGYMPN